MGKISVNFGASDAYTIELVWTQGTQSVTNNTTALHFACTLYSNRSSVSFTGQARTDTLTVGGVTVHPQHGYYVVPGGGSVMLWESDVTVTHDSDGTFKNKQISVDVKIDNTFSTSGYIGTVTATGTITLDTIPRASTLTFVAITLGKQVSVTIKPASSAFRHKLSLKVGSKTVTMLSDKAGGTYRITPTLADFAPQITDAASKSGTLTLQTYNTSGTLIGSNTYTVTVTVPSSAGPTVSDGWATATYDNTGTAAAAIAAFVQGHSRATVTFDKSKIETYYGATIKSYQITCNGVAVSEAPYRTGIMDQTNEKIVCSVTDSRGHTAMGVLNVSLYPYSPPTLSELSLYRANADGTENSEGTCIYAKAKLTFSDIGGLNDCSLQGFYRLAGGNYGSGVQMTSGVGTILTNAAAIEASYVAKIEAKDSLGNSRKFEATIPTADVAFNVKPGGKGAAFFKYAEKDGVLEVNGALEVEGIPVLRMKLLYTFEGETSGEQNVPIANMGSYDLILLLHSAATGYSKTNLTHSIIKVNTNHYAREILNVTSAAAMQVSQRLFEPTSDGVLHIGAPYRKLFSASTAPEEDTAYPASLSPYQVYGIKL